MKCDSCSLPPIHWRENTTGSNLLINNLKQRVKVRGQHLKRHLSPAARGQQAEKNQSQGSIERDTEHQKSCVLSPGKSPMPKQEPW